MGDPGAVLGTSHWKGNDPASYHEDETKRTNLHARRVDQPTNGTPSILNLYASSLYGHGYAELVYGSSKNHFPPEIHSHVIVATRWCLFAQKGGSDAAKTVVAYKKGQVWRNGSPATKVSSSYSTRGSYSWTAQFHLAGYRWSVTLNWTKQYGDFYFVTNLLRMLVHLTQTWRDLNYQGTFTLP